MLISGGKYRSEIDCFKLHKENKQRKSASAVEAKFTESLNMKKSKTLLKDRR